jgi:hypothetical protein
VDKFGQLRIPEEIPVAELPGVVQKEVHRIARKEFDSRPEDYGGAETLEGVYGPVHILRVTKTLYLFTFGIVDPYSDILYLFLYDPTKHKTSENPVAVRSGQPIPVSFRDIDRDGVAEIVANQNTHCGTECDWDTNHYYKICSRTELVSILGYTTISRGYCGNAECNRVSEIRVTSKNNVEKLVYNEISGQRRRLIGKIFYRKPDGCAPYRILRFKATSPKSNAELKFVIENESTRNSTE